MSPTGDENLRLPVVSVILALNLDARSFATECADIVGDNLTAEAIRYAPDAWVDHDTNKIGHEIPLTRHFYTYKSHRPLEELDAEIKQLEAEIQDLLAEVTE